MSNRPRLRHQPPQPAPSRFRSWWLPVVLLAAIYGLAMNSRSFGRGGSSYFPSGAATVLLGLLFFGALAWFALSRVRKRRRRG